MIDKKILLVEDDFTISFFTRSLLEKKGFTQIKAVTSGEEAIISAKTFKPDLILMDIILEGELDGISAAEKIQESMTVPVIYMSATTDKETLDRAVSTFVMGFVKKPFMSKDLYEALSLALGIKIE